MSTRGCVAVGTLRAWRGVYNHSDSYPGGLGVEVWQTAREKFGRGQLAGLCRLILSKNRWENVVRHPDDIRHHESADHLTNDTASPLHIEWIYVLDEAETCMHVLAGIERAGVWKYQQACSIPFDTTATPNWLMIHNFKENPEEFDPNRVLTASVQPKTAFERVLDDDLV